MSKKKIIAIVVLIFFAIISNILILKYVRISSIDEADVILSIDIKASDSDYFQVFYNDELDFSEDKSVSVYYEENEGKVALDFPINLSDNFLRIDLGNKPMDIEISAISILVYGKKYDINVYDVFSVKENLNQIKNVQDTENGVFVNTEGGDPHVLFMFNTLELNDLATKQIEKKSLYINVIFCLLIDLIIFVGIKKLKSFAEIPLGIIKERKLIWNLSKNDFKTKYAGSYLGIIWAFVQPIITVLVYWFVFEVGLKSGRVSEYPFILFLMSGLVPGFFFSDSLNGGTTSLIEYNYLVKKVVFNISVLPVVKVVSALFVHVFFIFVVGVVCIAYGYNIDVYWLQIPYYVICTIVLVLGLTYFTSTIVCFFRDLTQIISIVLQVGMWITPIMWQVSILSPTLQTIFKLNPMYYVVEGYRNCFLGDAWFWEDMTWTICFWITTVLIFGLGIATFKKLRIHFADVL